MRRFTRSILITGVLLCAAGLVAPLRGQPVPPPPLDPQFEILIPEHPDRQSPIPLPLDPHFPDTLTAALLFEAARVEEARLQFEAAASWRRLLPSLYAHASVTSRGLAFPAATADGFDPVHAALQRWPGDTWGLTATWRLDQLLERRTRRQAAEAALHTARMRMQVARARLEASAVAERARRVADSLRTAGRWEAIAAELQRAREEHAILSDLLRLARLRFEDGEAEYEAVQRARLAVLAKEGEIARLEREAGMLTESRRQETGNGHRPLLP